MKLITFATQNERPRLGASTGEFVVDLRAALAASWAAEMDVTLARELAAARLPDDMVGYLEAGEPTWQAGQQAYEYGRRHDGPFRHPWPECRLLAPIQPRVLIMGGANFYDHLDETRRGKPSEVEFFLKSTSAVIGPGEPVYYDPQLSQKYDYEVELGIVIGRAGRNILLERAFDHIFGYTIVNDISLRDQQIIPWDEGRFQIRFGQGKSFLSGAPVGPWIVTRDELPDVS
ncbi:MAG: fumarylacetoacetate hydrolase family protein, partial [Anaerolineae bacterium]